MTAYRPGFRRVIVGGKTEPRRSTSTGSDETERCVYQSPVGATDRTRFPSSAPPSLSAIEIADLTKRFGDVTGLDDLSFSVAEGEMGLRPYPERYFSLGRLDPFNAYVKVVNVLVNGDRLNPLLTNLPGHRGRLPRRLRMGRRRRAGRLAGRPPRRRLPPVRRQGRAVGVRSPQLRPTARPLAHAIPIDSR